ncbi:MAG TPA: MlaD family protein [Phycisphaerales bacterium]|nr:MlaD family protein [Phycisphaerales bacterium]
MSTRAARNNILAGGFVLTALALGVWASFKLSSVPPMSGLTRFTVRFSLEDGATGLKPGSEVLLAGQRIGRVLAVDFARQDGVPTGVVVDVETRADVTIYEDAGVFLQLPLLGTLSSINISSVGTGRVPQHIGATAKVETGDTVPGKLAPPAFLAQAGFGSEQVSQMRSSLASLEASLARVAGLIERSGPMVETSLSDAQALINQLRSKLSEWSVLVDRTAANIEKASQRLDPMLSNAETSLDDAAATATEVRRLVADNRDRLTQILANLESATAKLDRETLTHLNDALAKGRDALDTFSGALATVTTVVKQETPSLHRTMANLRLMSDQLKLTAIEIRSQPWRLLHTPTTKELSTQVLYDATRAYAEAASDLRAASEALKAVQTGDGAAEASETLTRAVEKYRAAEKALMERLIAEEK